MTDWSRRRAQSPWRSDGHEAAALRALSLRAAWPETACKLRRRAIDIGPGLASAVAAIEPVAELCVAHEEKLDPLCFQHGDPSPRSVRLGATGPSLIGGEAVYLGWWGRDAALLLNRCGETLDQALKMLCPPPERRPLILLWAILETISELAEARERDTGRNEGAHLRALIALLGSVSPLS